MESKGEGASQPMESAEISKYTNCIITCSWACGVNRTPSTLYSLNPEFRLYRKKTARRNAQEAHFWIVLVDIKLRQNGSFTLENSKMKPKNMLKKVFSFSDYFLNTMAWRLIVRYSLTKEDHFFEGGLSVLEEIGFENHNAYPANVHQYFSMNDNRLHGTSKQKWRNSSTSDDVESCLTLLKYLYEDTIKHSKYWFDRNLLWKFFIFNMDH